MQRPAAEVDPKSIQRSVKTCRRLLAYLLRASRLRIDPNMPDHRYNSLSSEMEDALIPLVVSERSALAFYRAFCARFAIEVSASGDSRWPIEVWLPEGRIRWDQTLSAMDYRDVRLVIHENPQMLVTFAFLSPCEGEDATFDAFPDPLPAGSYVPTLPGMIIAPRSYRTTWTLVGPMAHGADVKSGNVNLFRRHRVTDALTGQLADVPFMAGNAVRGLWRDMIMTRWLEMIGLKSTELPPARAHALFSGGAVEKGADTAAVNLPVRRRARELCPPWDLLAGCTDQQIMSGLARVHDAVLVCRENAWMIHKAIGRTDSVETFASSLDEACSRTWLRLGTRHAHREFAESDGQQMLFNTEHLIVGTQMFHSFQIFGTNGVSDVTASCLADLLNDFREYGTIGAGGSRGFGLIAFEPYQPGDGAPALPNPSIYIDYVAKRREEMRDWAMMRNEPAPPEKKPAKGKGRKLPAASPGPELAPDAEGTF